MKNGWFKVYWDFLDKLTPESALLLAYLIEIEPIMKNREGDYFRLSNSFIQERFQTWSDYTIKTKLDELIEKDYIEQEQKFKVEHSRGCKTRWVKIKFNPDDNTENNPKNNPKHKPENFGIKENKENKETKDNNIYGESSSPTKNKSSSANDSFEGKEHSNNDAPPPQEDRPKRLSLKDQLVNYINELDYEKSTKDILFKWIFTIGLPRKVRLEQLKDMLKQIWELAEDNETVVRESINNSYLNNWFGFYLPKKQGNSSETKPSNNLTFGNNKNPALTDARVVQRVKVGNTIF